MLRDASQKVLVEAKLSLMYPKSAPKRNGAQCKTVYGDVPEQNVAMSRCIFGGAMLIEVQYDKPAYSELRG